VAGNTNQPSPSRLSPHAMKAWLLPLLVGLVTAQSGDASCPCITAFPSGINPSDGVSIGSGTFFYPSSYGLNTCSAHDSSLAPYCDAADPPSWCADSWCYVDYATCSLPTAASSYFTGVTLHYSYATCGATNTFINWFGESGLEAASGSQTLDGLVNTIRTYLSSLVEVLETNEIEMRAGAASDGTLCSGVSSGCPCVGCSTLNNWDNSSLNFASTSMTVRPGVDTTSTSAVVERCLSGFLEHSFLHVASKEADFEQRIGYEYAAFNGQGTYAQWPATDTCNWGSYDPRFRPWYVGAATGPKDVVIVIDVSGSMQQNDRMDLAKEAASKVLDTLGDTDFVTVIKFSSSAEVALVQGTRQMVRATGTAIADLKSWIENLSPNGSTNFKAALEAALGAISDLDVYSERATCTKSVLFLSDGVPDQGSWTDSVSNNIQTTAQSVNARIFTYALGSNAPTDILKSISCNNRGAMWAVDDGGDLNNAMANYYSFLAPMYPACKLRWSYYNDSITGRPMIASCIQAYKKETTGQATSCGGGLTGAVGDLLGVVCMDVSLIVDKETLLARGDSDDFFSRVDADRAACNVVEPTESQLQTLRSRIDPAFGDATCPIVAVPAEKEVKMAFTVAGTVDDFTTAVRNAIVQKVAIAAGVAFAKVTLDVTSASVNLDFSIRTSTPDTTIALLAASVSNEADASTFFTTSELSVTVESIQAAPALVGEGEGDGGIPLLALIGGAAGGALCIIFVLCKICKGNKGSSNPQRPPASVTSSHSVATASASAPVAVAGRVVQGYYPDPNVPVGMPVQ